MTGDLDDITWPFLWVDRYERIRIVEDKATMPARWRKPRRVHLAADLFHRSVPDQVIASTFRIMGAARRHTFLIRTSAPRRMRQLLSSPGFDAPTGSPNVWLGARIETQTQADHRIPLLLDTPAAVRWASLEPPTERVDLTNCSGVDALGPDWAGGASGGTGCPHPLLDWVVVSGESGADSRPVHPDWVRSLRDQCLEADVPFLFRQWGDHVCVPIEADPRMAGGRAYSDPKYGGRAGLSIRSGRRSREPVPGDRWRDGKVMVDPDTIAIKVGRAKTGRELDGQTWDQYPLQP